MDLALSKEDRAFAERMREFFTTEIPAELRERMARGEHPTRDDVVDDAAHPQRARPGRAALAGRVGRAGLDADPAAPVGRGDDARARPVPDRVQHRHDRPGHRDVRQPGDEGALPAQDRQRARSGGRRASPSPTPAPTSRR